MYALTYDLDKRLEGNYKYKLSFYKSDNLPASTPLKSFHKYDTRNHVIRQKNEDGVVTFNGKNTTVKDGLLVTNSFVEGKNNNSVVPYEIRYFVAKQKLYPSRSERRRERKEAKKAKKTDKGGSISRKTKKQRRRTNKTRKSKI